MIKRLIRLSTETFDPEAIVCTFELTGDRVVVTYTKPETAKYLRHVQSIIFGGRTLTPNDGAAYFEALEAALRSTFYYVDRVQPGQSLTALPPPGASTRFSR